VVKNNDNSANIRRGAKIQYENNHTHAFRKLDAETTTLGKQHKYDYNYGAAGMMRADTGNKTPETTKKKKRKK